MSLKTFLLDSLFPQNCYGCGRGGTWFCPACFKKLQNYQGEKPRALAGAADLIIAGEYRDPLLGRLLRAFKFDGHQELARPLAAFLIQAVNRQIAVNQLTGKTWSQPIVVPLPLRKKRQRQRGFNQSAILAQALAAYYDYPFRADLIKVKKTAVQATLDETARLKNQAGAYQWHGAPLTGQTVLLIDDITTSGATLAAAAEALSAAGATRIIKLAVAKG
jgi:ComF family protein